MNADTYHNQSLDVANAKSGLFETFISNCIKVNGSKYKPSHWRNNIYEVETEDGVYITEQDFSPYVGRSVTVRTEKRHNGWLRFYLEKKPIVKQNLNIRYSIEHALDHAPLRTTFVYRITFGKQVYVGFTSKLVEKRIEEHKKLAFDKTNPGKQSIHKEIRRWGGYFDWEIVTECKNEIQGLLEEIRHIERFGTLNENDGGQGANCDIVPVLENNEEVYMVYDRNGLLEPYS